MCHILIVGQKIFVYSIYPLITTPIWSDLQRFGMLSTGRHVKLSTSTFTQTDKQISVIRSGQYPSPTKMITAIEAFSSIFSFTKQRHIAENACWQNIPLLIHVFNLNTTIFRHTELKFGMVFAKSHFILKAIHNFKQIFNGTFTKFCNSAVFKCTKL